MTARPSSTTPRPGTKKRPTEQQLQAAVGRGHIDGATRTGRRAQTRTCPTCRHRTLVGDDAHLAALTATVDPQPVLLADYAHHLATGRRLYVARGPAGHVELLHLDQWRVNEYVPPADRYPDRPQFTVHAEHLCTYKARLARQSRKVPR